MNDKLTDRLLSWLWDGCAAIAREIGMTEPIKGWDGEVWTCIVRTVRPGGFVEAALNLKPDSLGQGAELSVLARAWKPGDHEAVWSRTYWSQFVTSELLEAQGEELRDRLARVTQEAWAAANEHVARLSEVKSARSSHLETLRAKAEENRRRAGGS